MVVYKYPNIEAERARRGLTKTEIATAFGVTRKTYVGWITTGNIPQSKMSKIVEFFGLSSDYLFGSSLPGYIATT